MDSLKYDDEIRSQIQTVKAVHRIDSRHSRELCESLIVKARELQDNSLMGFAYYYLAESYYLEDEYPLFVSNLLLGLKYQLQPPMPILLAKSYNMLGINDSYAGDISMAMDHYLNSLQYAEQAGNSYMAAVAHYNIAMIYRDLADMEAAIASLKKGLASFEASPHTEDQQRNISVTYSSLASCYLEAGDAETAMKYFELQDKKTDDLAGDAHIVAIAFEIRYYHTVGDQVRRDAAIEAMLTAVENTSHLMGVYDEIILFCDFLHKVDYLDQLWRLLCSIEAVNTRVGIPGMMLKYLTFKARYYEGKGLQKNYLAVCAEYFALSKRLEKENHISLKNSIRLREELKKIKAEQQQMQTEHKLLLDKSRRDYLTNLPNREWLNEYTEAAFTRAFQNRTRLAVEILDIDNFKQYNDTLGHMAGDRYLQALSNLLHALIEQGLFCARHGGDEFVIIYENRSDSEVLEIAEFLRQEVMAISLAEQEGEAFPPITVSQGICSSLPMPWERIWDYFHIADQALYYSKNAGRNTIRLTPYQSQSEKNPAERFERLG